MSVDARPVHGKGAIHIRRTHVLALAVVVGWWLDGGWMVVGGGVSATRTSLHWRRWWSSVVGVVAMLAMPSSHRAIVVEPPCHINDALPACNQHRSRKGVVVGVGVGVVVVVVVVVG